jgi:hypothetical protein
MGESLIPLGVASVHHRFDRPSERFGTQCLPIFAELPVVDTTSDVHKSASSAGADSAGERSTATYSVIGSAGLSSIDPEAYLHCVHRAHRSSPGELDRRTVTLKCGFLDRRFTHRSRPLAADRHARQHNSRPCSFWMLTQKPPYKAACMLVCDQITIRHPAFLVPSRPQCRKSHRPRRAA